MILIIFFVYDIFLVFVTPLFTTVGNSGDCSISKKKLYCLYNNKSKTI